MIRLIGVKELKDLNEEKDLNLNFIYLQLR